MKVTLNLTEDHLKVIPFVLISNEKDNVLEIDKERIFIVQSSVLDDMAMMLGMNDKALPLHVNDAMGKSFPDNVEEHLLDVYKYVKDNLYYIETLIHQFVVKGGLTEGTYVADSEVLLWEKR